LSGVMETRQLPSGAKKTSVMFTLRFHAVSNWPVSFPDFKSVGSRVLFIWEVRRTVRWSGLVPIDLASPSSRTRNRASCRRSRIRKDCMSCSANRWPSGLNVMLVPSGNSVSTVVFSPGARRVISG